MLITTFNIFKSLNEALSTDNVYELFGETVYVYDTDYRGGKEYVIYYKKEDRTKQVYVGEIKDIEEDFLRSNKPFILKKDTASTPTPTPTPTPKPKPVKKTPTKVEYYNIVLYLGKRKMETIKWNVHKSEAYAFKNYFQKLEKYRSGTVKLEPVK